jgi:hypothetical protein
VWFGVGQQDDIKTTSLSNCEDIVASTVNGKSKRSLEKDLFPNQDEQEISNTQRLSK